MRIGSSILESGKEPRREGVWQKVGSESRATFGVEKNLVFGQDNRWGIRFRFGMYNLRMLF